MYCYLNPASTNHDLSYEHQQDGVYLGDHRLNPDTNYYHHRHQQQDGVFSGDHRLKPDTNYYHRRRQQEGVNLGDYHMNPKPEYCPNQQQPKRQRHSAWGRYSRSYEEAGEISKNYYMSGYTTNPRRNYYNHRQQPRSPQRTPFYFSPISTDQRTSQDYAASCAKITADAVEKYERGVACSRPPTDEGILDYEGILAYESSVEESDGFDVKPMPAGFFLAGNIVAVNLSREFNRSTCEKAAQFAIAAFNAKYERSKGELKLEKLVRASQQAVAGFLYYLTFDATNVAKKSTKTYQAKVVLGPAGANEVIAFRRQDSKKWYWNDSC